MSLLSIYHTVSMWWSNTLLAEWPPAASEALDADEIGAASDETRSLIAELMMHAPIH